MTKKELFNALLEMECVQSNEEIKKGVEHELTLLEIKSNREKKPTQNQIQNENLKKKILEYIRENGKKAVRELIVEVEELSTLSTSKVAALVTGLCKEGKLSNTETVKKVRYYDIVEGE